jgi:ATP-dependent DNA ligase
MRAALRRLIPDASDFASATWEGIVAKHRFGRYATEKQNPAWVKIRNGRYSQMIRPR